MVLGKDLFPQRRQTIQPAEGAIKLRRGSELTKTVLSEANLHQLELEHQFEKETPRKEMARGRSVTQITLKGDRAKTLIQAMQSTSA